MGAEQFETTFPGETPEVAFKGAVDEAQYDHGHSGYSGTIAEKDSFTLVDTPETGKDNEIPESLWDRFDDKWGPAGCYKVKEGLYCFFGWASS
jgi:hypothetical protein